MSSPESASPHGCQFTNDKVFPSFSRQDLKEDLGYSQGEHAGTAKKPGDQPPRFCGLQ